MLYDVNKILSEAGIALPTGITADGFYDQSKIKGGMEAWVFTLQFGEDSYIGYVYHRDIEREPFSKLAIDEVKRVLDGHSRRLDALATYGGIAK